MNVMITLNLDLMEDVRVRWLQKCGEKMNPKTVRQPGIEPGSIAWKATMLTFTPPTLDICYLHW